MEIINPFPKLASPLISNHHYWIDWSRNVFRRQIAVLRKVIVERLLPTFDLIEKEADTVSDEIWERLNAIDDPDGDPGMDAETAEQARARHFLAMVDAKQSLLNLFAVVLHHLLEQQQFTLIRQEWLPHSEDVKKQVSEIAKSPTKEFVRRLNESDIKAETFPSFVILKELRHVANAVKHADGWSADWLRKRCPEIFKSPYLSDKAQKLVQNPLWWPFQPLSGQDLYVTVGDIERYFGAADSFWREFEEALVFKAERDT